MGERLNGIQEVRGSIPLSSTTKRFGCLRCLCGVPWPLKERRCRLTRAAPLVDPCAVADGHPSYVNRAVGWVPIDG